MTQDVVAHGDDAGPRSRRGLATGLAALLALVAIGVVAHRHSTSAAPRPVPSVSPTPTTPARDGTLVRRPALGRALGVLLGGGTPGWVVDTGAGVNAFTAAGGPEFAEVLVGWCRSSLLFEDTAGDVYRPDGTPLTGGLTLPVHDVEVGVNGDPGLLRIADAETRAGLLSGGGATSPTPSTTPRHCTDIAWPPLPPSAPTIEQAARAFRRVTGRYVATTESFAFCPAPRGGNCHGNEWDTYAVPSLPPGDLASEYVWEGGYLIRADGARGTFRAVRLPDARLVRRSHVGVSAVAGIVQLANDQAGRHVIRFLREGNPPGPARDYVVRLDAEIYLGRGYTGLGQPRGTFATFRRFLAAASDTAPTVWLVLDARGQVIRIAAERTSAP